MFQHVKYKTQKPIYYKAQTVLNSNILKRPQLGHKYLKTLYTET